MPGVLLAEHVAQSALLFADMSGFMQPGERLLLSRLRCDFLKPVRCPAIVEVKVQVHLTGNIHFKFQGTSLCSQKEVLRAKGIGSKVGME